MPTKIAEFLACGRPVVVNSGLGDFDQYLSEFNAGVILSGTRADTKAKAQELMNLLSDPETPYRCRALAEKYFDIREGAKKYLDLYDKM
jgi:glycosyltransferase involved in cell wall biosynthesis